MVEDGPGQDPELPKDARLASLDERLGKAQQDEAVRIGRKQPALDSNYRLGSRVLGELVGCPAGGALFGWLLDRWLDTRPWLLLAGLFLGIGVAFWNIVKISNGRAE